MSRTQSPVVPSARGAPAEEPTFNLGAASRPALRILVVDDDAVFRDELGSLLRDDGHTVQTAASVDKAIAQLEAQEFDIVFSDLKMPRQSGLVLLKQVRARWPRLFVVMVTGYATVETAVEAMKLGAFDYVRKPFQMEQIQQTIQLVAQEIAFTGDRSHARDPVEVARGWAKRRGIEVLLVAEHGAKGGDRVQFLPLRPEDPSEALSAVRGFVADHPAGGVVLSGVDRYFIDHRLEDIVKLIRDVRESMDGHGPLAIGFDPSRISTSAATALREAVAAPRAHETLDALTNPIRRLVLRRLQEGPSSFSEAMRAAGLDDSPKLSFHLRKLVEEGLVAHSGEEYRLTGKGRGAVELLGAIDTLSASDDGRSFVFSLAAPPMGRE